MGLAMSDDSTIPPRPPAYPKGPGQVRRAVARVDIEKKPYQRGNVAEMSLKGILAKKGNGDVSK